jgi:hypothetical protein
MQHYIDKMISKINNNNGLKKMCDKKNTVENEEDIDVKQSWQSDNNTRY